MICGNLYMKYLLFLRLVVNLTQPAELCFGNKVPEDKTTRNYYLEVLSHLQAYKQAFADEELMIVLAKKLKKLLDMVRGKEIQ